MATKTSILSVKIVSDASDFTKKMDQSVSKLDKFKATAAKMTVPAAAIVAGIGAIAVSSGKLASEAQQNFGAVDAVFKDHAKAVQDMAKKADMALGLSASDYNKYAALIGSQLKNAGIPMDQLGDQTKKLIGFGADFKAQFGGTVPEAVEALSSALKGEMDPIEKYGISLNESAIKAELARMGMTGLTGAAETQAKAQAIMNLIQTQGADAMGAFARETETAAGKQAQATAAWDNAQAMLGEVLLPIMTQAALVLADVAKWVQENSGLVQTLAVVFGILAGAVLVLNGVMLAMNLIAALNPFVFLAIGIAAVVAGLILAYNNIGWFKDAVNSVGRFAVDTFNNISNAVQSVISWVSSLFNGFRIPGWMRDVMSFMGMGGTGFDFNGTMGFAPLAPGEMGIGATGGMSIGSMFGGSSAAPTINNYNVTVTGALDPDAVGRQLEDILNRRARNTGARSAAGGF